MTIRHSRAVLVALSLLLAASLHAKLTSPSYQQDRASDIITDLLRETRLEDDSHWGQQFQTDIDHMTRLMGSGQYQIFADLKIQKAMARCAVYARNESDYRRWLDMMARFDQAAEELNSRDKSRYYFARGLAIMHAIPDKLRDLPEPFYLAAQNGYSSSFLAEYIQKSTGATSERAGAIFERLARSYQRGENPQEAYKFYMLALRAGQCNTDLILSMITAASQGGNDSLAWRTGNLFLALFSPWDGARSCNGTAAAKLPFSAAMPAAQIWEEASSPRMDTICTVLAGMREGAHGPIRERDLNRYDSRYIQTFLRSTGSYSDLFLIALVRTVWDDSLMVRRFVPRIEGGIDDSRGQIAALATQLRNDNRFADDAELIRWEYTRWNRSGKENEFMEAFPQRSARIGVRDPQD